MTGHQRERQADLKNRFALLLGQQVDETAPVKKAAAKAAPVKKAAAEPRKTPPRGAAATQAAAVEPMPITQPATDEARPKRLMVPLSVDEDRALKEYRMADGFAAAARIRAMLQLYRTDDRFRRKVDQTARDMRH